RAPQGTLAGTVPTCKQHETRRLALAHQWATKPSQTHAFPGRPAPRRRGHQIRDRSSSVPRSMARRSLRPQLNQIRTWVRQGRTDAWIAHQLDVTVQQIQAFKREQDLEPNGDKEGPVATGDFD